MSQAVRERREARHEHDVSRRTQARQQERAVRARRLRRTRLLWLAALAVLAVLVGAMLLSSSPSTSALSGPAPPFALPSTSGSSVSLADYAGKPVLLYFNEGTGCDACFYQMVEIERNLGRFEQLGVAVMPIAANPAAQLQEELDRFQLDTPWLSDTDVQVSEAYGMVGRGMHAGLPGHGFVLVDENGSRAWSGEYPSMYITADDLLEEIRNRV